MMATAELTVKGNGGPARKKQDVHIIKMRVLSPPEPLPAVKGTPSHETLKKLAAKYRPPAKWLEGDEEDLF
jgi:hypothetical protein